ncbi:PucR family transcriptional regulator [Yinghuangia soli]|uniref:PucR family transcriptional regulator n=1 Tax=Yinghuangia soli TaxID=2908204 RepID=A0AA41U048_9ACTN|nr:PucR family transcriptional regulator [Yinghuangia soli]MCF2529453.1 PucR family transcriptional regulator [Yinghuangia soli]
MDIPGRLAAVPPTTLKARTAARDTSPSRAGGARSGEPRSGDSRTGDTAPLAGITVRQALELPPLRRGLPEVVAGPDGLDRPIRWVHTGEVPNIASLLRGEELLLTTGLGIGPRPADHRRFVAQLADRGIAALVVELGQRFDVLPAAMVEAARLRNLPLIQLHREVPFVAVTEAIHTEIVNGHYALLRQGEEVHRRCTEILLSGGGVPEVLELLAEHVGNPVYLEDADGRLLYTAAPPGTAPDGDADPLDAWAGLRGGRHPAATAGAYDRPPTALVPGTALVVDVPAGGPTTGGGTLQPIRGRLVVLPVHGPMLPLGRIVVDHAAGLLAVALRQARHEEELAARGRGDFLSDLAEGRVAEEDAARQARVLGFVHENGPLLPVVVRLASDTPGDGVGSGVGATDWAPIARAVQEELSALGLPVLLGVRPVEGRLALLLGLRAAGERVAVADRVAAALRAGLTRAGLAPGPQPPVVVVGAAGPWGAAGAGLRHAAEAAAAARGLSELPWYDARRLDIELLLWRMREHADLAAFVRRAVGPLLEHDRTARQPLLPTLQAYLTHAGRKAETARDLHLNRQTLYDRLARIAQLLGTDLDDPETVLGLRLALQARRHVHE